MSTQDALIAVTEEITKGHTLRHRWSNLLSESVGQRLARELPGGDSYRVAPSPLVLTPAKSNLDPHDCHHGINLQLQYINPAVRTGDTIVHRVIVSANWFFGMPSGSTMTLRLGDIDIDFDTADTANHETLIAAMAELTMKHWVNTLEDLHKNGETTSDACAIAMIPKTFPEPSYLNG